MVSGKEFEDDPLVRFGDGVAEEEDYENANENKDEAKKKNKKKKKKA